MCKTHCLCLSVVLMFSLSSAALAAIASLEPYDAGEETNLVITYKEAELKRAMAKPEDPPEGSTESPSELSSKSYPASSPEFSQEPSPAPSPEPASVATTAPSPEPAPESSSESAPESPLASSTMPPTEDNNSTSSSDSDSSSSNNTDSGSAAAAVTDLLRIDSTTLYPGMENTYAQGYIPKIENEKACIVLPLAGDTYDQKVTMSVDLGSTADSPFVFGNYSQTAGLWDGVYLFRLEIPLAANRVNGTYPVTLTVAYLNATGNQTQQSFTIYATITDGRDPTQNTGTEPERKAVEKPKLFISACEIIPGIISGEEEFKVALTIENIGAIRARSVILSYGSDAVGIVPKQTNNSVHLANIAAGRNEEAFFELMTTKEVLAGNQSFYVRLDYEDLYGGIYTETRTFFVSVTQPAEMEFDPISIPGQLTSGENISVPINVFNTGKSTLQNVFVTISVPGLYPTTSSFFGDVPPGQSTRGEMKIHVGTLSLSGVLEGDYGKTKGVVTIIYHDENGEEHKAEADISTEIMPPAAEEANIQIEEKTVGQWWISVLVTFAIISIMVASMIVARFTRLLRIK